MEQREHNVGERDKTVERESAELGKIKEAIYEKGLRKREEMGDIER